MTDFLGNELHINDIIAYYHQTSTSGGYMRDAKIIGFCKRSSYNCVKVIPVCENTKLDSWLTMYPLVMSTHKIVKI